MSKTVHYDNYKLYSLEDKLLGFISLRKFNWYLKKKLVTQIDEKSIKLCYPTALTYDLTPYGNYLNNCKPKENKCVVCGDTGEIRQYSVIPKEIKKYIPTEIKSLRLGDVIVLCVDHTSDGNYYQNKFKNILYQKYGIDKKKFSGDSEMRNMKIIISRIIKRSKPGSKKRNKINEYMTDKITSYFGYYPNLEQMKDFLNSVEKENKIIIDGCSDPDELLLKRVLSSNDDTTDNSSDDDLSENCSSDNGLSDNGLSKNHTKKIFKFLQEWKNVFLENMNPMYLPWDFFMRVDYELQK